MQAEEVPMVAIGSRAKVEFPPEVLARFTKEMARMTEETPQLEKNIGKAFEMAGKGNQAVETQQIE
jgi:hypothetical protein